MKIFGKHLLRKIKESPLQPILIVCALCIAVLSILIACKVSLYLHEDAERSSGVNASVGELSVKLSSKSATRLLFADQAEELIGDDGCVLGEFIITGVSRLGTQKELLSLSASDLEKADEFYQFKFTSYGEFTEENRESAIILSKDTADRYHLSVGDPFSFSLLGRTYEFTVQAIALPYGALADCAGVVDISAITEELARHNPAIASLSGNFAPANVLHIKLNQEARTDEFAALLASHPAFADKDIIRQTDNVGYYDSMNQLTVIIALTVCFIVLVLSGVLMVGALDILGRQRRRDTALFMLAGADRSHLNRLQYLESLLYGIAGMIGGVLLSFPSYTLFSRMAKLEHPLSYAHTDLLLAAVCAPALILFFTYLRTKRAERLTVSELLKEVQSPIKRQRSLKSVLALALLATVLLAVSLLTPTHRRHMTVPLPILACICLLFVLAPLFIDLVSIFVCKILAKKRSLRSLLFVAASNIRASYSLQHVGRLMTLVIAFLIPITLCTQAASNEAELFKSTVQCDYIALGADRDTDSILQKDDAVTDTFRMSLDHSLVTVYGTGVDTVTAEAEALAFMCEELKPTRLPEGDEIVLASGIASLYGAKVGDRVEFLRETVTYTFTVIEIIGTPAHFAFADAAYIGTENDMLCIRTSGDETADELYARLSNLLELRGAMLYEHETVMRPTVKRLDAYVSLVECTSFAAFLTTFIGIVNLIFAQHHARKNDFHAYRSAGMTRAGVRRLECLEILLLLFAALLLAIPFGVGFCALIDLILHSFGADLLY